MSNKQLVRSKTCSTCPFRGGFHLNYNRRLDIAESLTRKDETFYCHNEVDYDDSGGEPNTHGASQCAGATTVLLREGHYNQAMRWHARFMGGDKLEEDPKVPFATLQDWIHEPEFSHGAPPVEEEGYTCEVVWDDCECPAGWSAGGGVADNHNRLEHPVNFCGYCGRAMCDPCKSEHDEDGLMTCLACAEDLEGGN